MVVRLLSVDETKHVQKAGAERVPECVYSLLIIETSAENENTREIIIQSCGLIKVTWLVQRLWWG